MEIVLIRHTTPALASGICYGQSDVPLAEHSARDIKHAIEPIPKVDRVYSSPSQRCALLATALVQRDQCPLVFAPALQELNFGDWEQLPWSQIPREHSDPWAEDTWTLSPPGGETERQLWKRVSAWYETMLEEPVARCAIVAHGGSLRALRCLMLGLDVTERWNWALQWGEHQRFSVED